YADRGEGFCLFNDIAIASNELIHNGEVDNVLIIDLDVHQGNGTASIFQDNPRVFTFSMHGEHNYPLRKEVSDLDIGVPDGINDHEYLSILEKTLIDLESRVIPDIIFYLSGVDVLKSDKLGRLGMTIEGCRQRDAMVFEFCAKQNIPVAVSMGGGYSVHIKDIIEAHANTFREAKRVFT
ncbi:MAG: histone deacetylase, partial [Flavobacteriales bacterium]|nr:histone deacetylase [Flavobacteriales bacterium]